MIVLWIPVRFLFRFLTQNFDWLDEQLEDIDDEYYIFDCPGNCNNLNKIWDRGSCNC